MVVLGIIVLLVHPYLLKLYVDFLHILRNLHAVIVDALELLTKIQLDGSLFSALNVRGGQPLIDLRDVFDQE